jgi:hypothetical protein
MSDRRRGPITTNGFELSRSLAVSGAGLLYSVEALIADEIARGKLQLALESYATRLPGPYLYFPSRATLSPPFRAFVDLACGLTTPPRNVHKFSLRLPAESACFHAGWSCLAWGRGSSQRRLGKELEVTALGYGAMGFEDSYDAELDRRGAVAFIRAAFERGSRCSIPPRRTDRSATRSWSAKHLPRPRPGRNRGEVPQLRTF